MAELDLGMVRPALVDDLTSDRADAALTAKQGKELKRLVDLHYGQDRISLDPAISGSGFCILEVDHATRMVLAYGWLTATSSFSVNVALYTIPEAYRPSANHGLVMVIKNSDGSISMGSCTAKSSGAIDQSISSTAKNCVFFGSYPLALEA